VAEKPVDTTSAEATDDTLPTQLRDTGAIDDVPPSQMRETGAQLQTSTKELLLRIPLEVQKQIDGTAANALEEIFSTLLERMMRPARDRANMDAGLDAPLIKSQHIYEVRQSVLHAEFASNLTRMNKVYRTLSHLCAAVAGGIAERCLVEGKLGPLEVFLLIGALVLLLFLTRADPLSD
jgi:hypothetical protein